MSVGKRKNERGENEKTSEGKRKNKRGKKKKEDNEGVARGGKQETSEGKRKTSEGTYRRAVDGEVDSAGFVFSAFKLDEV